MIFFIRNLFLNDEQKLKGAKDSIGHYPECTSNFRPGGQRKKHKCISGSRNFISGRKRRKRGPIMNTALKSFNVGLREFGTGFAFVPVQRFFLRVAPPSLKRGKRHSGATVPEMGI